MRLSAAGNSDMDEFFDEQIEVQQDPASPRPVRFTWRGKAYDVAEVLSCRVDIGYGDMPAASRKWYTRRHRRCYSVKDTDGAVFEIYLDYSNKKKHTWWLVSRKTGPAGEAD